MSDIRIGLLSVYFGLFDESMPPPLPGASSQMARSTSWVCAPSMAAPPSYASKALAEVPDALVLVLVAQESGSVPNDYDTEAATRRSLPVGAVMITNVLVREGRDFTVVVGALQDESFGSEVGASITGVGGGTSSTAWTDRLVLAPIAGYWDVEASEGELSRLGIDVDHVTVTEDEVGMELETVRSMFAASSVPAEVLERSARVASRSGGCAKTHR